MDAQHDNVSPEPLITATQLARILGCSAKAVYARRAKGDLPPAVVIGVSSLRWRPEVVAAWLQAREEAGS